MPLARGAGRESEEPCQTKSPAAWHGWERGFWGALLALPNIFGEAEQGCALLGAAWHVLLFQGAQVPVTSGFF